MNEITPELFKFSKTFYKLQKLKLDFYNQIRMSSESQQFICSHCDKKYTQYQSLYVHLKVKHKDLKEINNISLRNFEIQKQSFLETEDLILVLFGQLAQKHAYSLETLIEQNLYDSKNHAAGKNHFSSNSIVNNPYEALEQDQQIEKKIGELKKLNFTQSSLQKQIVINQIQALNSVLSAENRKWFYADPYGDSVNFQQQFSLDDIPKLAKNYYSRGLKLKNPQTTIFMLWIARLVKKEPFQDIFRIVCFLSANMQQFKRVNKIQNGENPWMKYLSSLKQHKMLSKRYQQLEINLKKEEFISIGVLYCEWSYKILTLIKIFNIEQ